MATIAAQRPAVIVTDQDHQRLTNLINSFRGFTPELLADELARAHVVSQHSVPPDVVTMHSVVSFRDEETGVEREMALVYPNNANISEGRLSVLAPMGTALLGLTVGQTIEWPVPEGKTRSIRVLAVAFQPEALGAYDL
jgi:regulator of nucleoside diphosphate kinase